MNAIERETDEGEGGVEALVSRNHATGCGHSSMPEHGRDENDERPWGRKRPRRKRRLATVDVLVPVHNASGTVVDAVMSALNQRFPLDAGVADAKGGGGENGILASGSRCRGTFGVGEGVQGSDDDEGYYDFDLDVAVCCYDDGSSDDSLELLRGLKLQHDRKRRSMDSPGGHPENGSENQAASGQVGENVARCDGEERSDDSHCRRPVRVQLLVSSASPSRGAGYARNRAAELRRSLSEGDGGRDGAGGEFLCLLDSDDVMHPTRVAEQVAHMLALPPSVRSRTLLGCQFVRSPPDSTWHYAAWANGLSDSRLHLEQFREVTLVQPTWMVCRERFEALGGYIEAPPPVDDGDGRGPDVAPIEQSDLQSHGKKTMPSRSFHSCGRDSADANADGDKSRLVLTIGRNHDGGVYRLVCRDDTPHTMRLAEDLRFFHAHLAHGERRAGSFVGRGGLLQLVRARSRKPGSSQREGCASDEVGDIEDSSGGKRHVDSSPGTSTKPPPALRSDAVRKGAATTPPPVPELPLLTYRHRAGRSQSSETPRRLLLRLRLRAFEDRVLRRDPLWTAGRGTSPGDGGGGGTGGSGSDGPGGGFAVWGAGRDGKDFVKNLSPDLRSYVRCLVDVDEKKIRGGFYVNRDIGVRVPIVHFSALARTITRGNMKDDGRGRGCTSGLYLAAETGDEGLDFNFSMEKGRNSAMRRGRDVENDTDGENSIERKGHDVSGFSRLPIVVCVAMYRTNGALERNVSSVGRTEGVDLWHFS